MKTMFAAAIALTLVGTADAQTRKPAPKAAPRAAAKPVAIPKPEPVKALPIFNFLGVNTETITPSISFDGKVCAVAATGETGCDAPFSSKTAIGNAQLVVLLTRFYNGKLYSVSGSTIGGYYLDILAAFTAKYGVPITKSEKWQSKAGATFDNTVNVWKFKGGELELRQMGSRRDNTDFMFIHEGNAPPPKDVPVNF